MKTIKKPYDIDLVVDGSALNPVDLIKIDEAISHYKSMKNQEKTEMRRINIKNVKQ